MTAAAGPRARPGAWLAGAGGRAAAMALACVLLTAAFFVMRFPADRFRDSLVARLAAATGVAASVGHLAARPGLGGLTLVADEVALRWPGGAALDLDRAALRPAWSFSWLRGRPAWHVDLRSEVGGLAGTVWPGGAPAFSGRLDDVAVAKLPPELLGLAEGLAATGSLDADLEVEGRDGRVVGSVGLALADGSFSVPGAPLAVPFDRLDAELELGSDGAVELESARLEGPMLAGEAAGRIGPAPSLELAPLALDAELEVREPALRGWLAPLGIAQSGEGRAKLRIGGTLAEPVVR